MSCISTPATGTPIEPGLRSRSGGLNVAIAAVSESPLPSSTLQPNAASKPRRISTGIAAPPETHSRRVEAS